MFPVEHHDFCLYHFENKIKRVLKSVENIFHKILTLSASLAFDIFCCRYFGFKLVSHTDRNFSGCMRSMCSFCRDVSP